MARIGPVAVAVWAWQEVAVQSLVSGAVSRVAMAQSPWHRLSEPVVMAELETRSGTGRRTSVNPAKTVRAQQDRMEIESRP